MSAVTNTNSWYYQDNPLLNYLPSIKDASEMADAIAFNPLEYIDVTKLDFTEKLALLNGEKTPLEPSTLSLKSSLTWYGMLMGGLRARNPSIAANRKIYFDALKNAQSGENIYKCPTQGISVNILKGPTGTGKTVTYQRFCSTLPQTIDHVKNEVCGWVFLKQLVYLVVQMSHDGSRGGFLIGILSEMDKVLGTDYATTLPKSYKSVEKLSLATIGRLIAHFTGILFIDEGQIRNLVESGQAELMQMFLLQMMNTGIPIVLVGNEKAFDWITFSQDKSRLYLTPISHFPPCGALGEIGAENEWVAISDGIINFYVLDNPPIDIDECRHVLKMCSGGIARIALTLWCFTQINALFSGKNLISAQDVLDAYHSYSFKELRPLADGFTNKNWTILARYPDVDWEFYKNQWQHSVDESNIGINIKHSSTNAETLNKENDRRTSEATKLKRENTKRRNAEKKKQQLFSQLSEDDIRKNGLVNQHLQALDSLKDMK
ncbi:MAG TPA: ATP-binding protein [Methylophilus sp.]|nr:ATP-binding protein [Methylophilus sp.]